ncbi:hypothetical protein [uncultured Bacteroides sp.]|uniref:hypothetical protein n=1 Tax=uncultured Bacteroides sp. TaxID=162156 RepID=UPI0025967B53|nr:hypothetical protein [uncultured Bacteroides sp.]
MNEKDKLNEDAKFYEKLYRKTLERCNDETKKYYELVKKHNKLKDDYDDIKLTNIRLLGFLVLSIILNVILTMLN